jgi:hypothetical protein
MSKKTETNTPTDPWDSGELGRDESYVGRAPAELLEEIDVALDLQMISIRLIKENIKELKFIADYRGIGYQPLIRDVLSRFARSEITLIARELQEQKKAQAAIAEQMQQKKERAYG